MGVGLISCLHLFYHSLHVLFIGLSFSLTLSDSQCSLFCNLVSILMLSQEEASIAFTYSTILIRKPPKFSPQHSVYFIYIALAGVIISPHNPLLFYFIFFTFNYTWMVIQRGKKLLIPCVS